MWLTVVTAVAAFAATNLDDLFVLMLFFGQSPGAYRRRHIVLGQYLGFGALLAISLLGFAGRFVIPPAYLGLLGLAPIIIGLRQLAQHRVGRLEPGPAPAGAPPTGPLAALGLFSPQTYAVAAVTFANGGDNLGIYTPLFSSLSAAGLAVTLGVFLALVAVWCLVSLWLTRQPAIARPLARFGHVLVPFVLIALGVYIVLQNGTMELFGLVP